MNTTDAGPPVPPTTPPPLPPILPEQSPTPEKTLRRLFLTLFLRGRGARGLKKQGAPKTVTEKLGITLFFYLLLGCVALAFLRQPVFALAVYLHAMTFAFLGMFVASSAGEMLFNKEEGDILMHRPVTPKAMLWAKIRVLIEVSLWIAGAFNVVGLFVGWGSAGGWRFPLIHLLSTALEAVFCTGCVVLVYQLCLRWFGRQRLEGLMTAAQVCVSIAAVLCGQILPRLIIRFDRVLDVGVSSWWINLIPPAWFAGLDDAFAGTSQPRSWLLAGLAVLSTSLVLWLAFSRLAASYEAGLQALNEAVSSRAGKPGRRRWLDTVIQHPPLSWWMRNPVERATFLLAAAYMIRDRDVKLRLYPGIAPVFVIPFVFLLQGRHQSGFGASGFGVAFCGVYLGMVPLMGLQLLQYSQQWQASDIFRAAPMAGPAAICHGARRAILCLLALPMVLLVGLVVWLLGGDARQLILFLPGLIALPIFALAPNLGGRAVPLSQPTDAAKSTRRGVTVFATMIFGFGLAGVAAWSWSAGWFWRLVLVEIPIATGLYILLRHWLSRTAWAVAE
jgi:hypothetical protein